MCSNIFFLFLFQALTESWKNKPRKKLVCAWRIYRSRADKCMRLWRKKKVYFFKKQRLRERKIYLLESALAWCTSTSSSSSSCNEWPHTILFSVYFFTSNVVTGRKKHKQCWTGTHRAKKLNEKNWVAKKIFALINGNIWVVPQPFWMSEIVNFSTIINLVDQAVIWTKWPVEIQNGGDGIFFYFGFSFPEKPNAWTRKKSKIVFAFPQIHSNRQFQWFRLTQSKR